MGLYRLFILTALVGFSCSEDVTLQDSDLNQSIHPNHVLLSQNWEYRSIEVNGRFYTTAERWTIDPNDFAYIPEMELSLRRFQYSKDHLYRLNWTEGGEYDLGFYEFQGVHQPPHGTWHLSESGNEIIHNPNTPNEVTYQIVGLEEGALARKSLRRAGHNAPDDTWRAGELIEFVEHFVAVD